MKKIHLFTLLASGIAGICSAQLTIYSQNFETSKTTIPTGWHQQLPSSAPTNLGWQFNNTFGSGYFADFFLTNGSYMAFVDDMDNNSTSLFNFDTLYSSKFSLAGYNHVYISMDENYLAGYISTPGDAEVATIAVSIDGGLTWNTADTLPSVSKWTTETFNLDAYAGQPDVMLAFTYTDGGYNMFGIILDNIKVFEPLNYDLAVTKQNSFYLLRTGKANTFTGTIHNFGGDSIVSMNLNYSVNGGPLKVDALSSLSFLGNTDYSFSHTITWTPSTAGIYTVKFWADHLNGTFTDQNHSNDTLTAHFMVIDSIQPKEALLEYFMQASADPCMYDEPNLYAVERYGAADTILNSLSYHVDWPGVDYMNVETDDSDVIPRVGYYGLGIIPDVKLDGDTDIDAGAIGVPNVQAAAGVGSPFKITIKSAIYTISDTTYTINCIIKSYSNFDSGLTVQAVLSVDTIKYISDQSNEDSPSSFAPPLGSGSNPDSLFPYVVNFPDVVEDLMPSASGTALNSFTSGQTQTLSFFMEKEPSLGETPNTFKYDSLFPGDKVTIFVQTDSGINSFKIPAHYIFQSASSPVQVNLNTGSNDFSGGAGINVYPNPSQGIFNIQWSNVGAQNLALSIEIYNVLGENVYSKFIIHNSQFTINISAQPKGIYFARLITDHSVIVKRLVIQ